MSNPRQSSNSPSEEISQKRLLFNSINTTPGIPPLGANQPSTPTYKTKSLDKFKLGKPSTTKNTPDTAPYFHSRTNTSKNEQNSNKQQPTSIKQQSNAQSISKPTLQTRPRGKSRSAKNTDQIIREEVVLQPKAFKIEQRSTKTEANSHPPMPEILAPIRNYQPAKHSKNGHGTVKAYSASTNQGPVREYNEDRVAIILNFSKPENVSEWKKPAYFGVFDGHGGMDCADFLRDNLHLFIAKEKLFPQQLHEAIQNGFDKCERTFLEHSYHGKVDKSGSCALIALMYGKDCYIANVGDSRAIMSCRKGQYIRHLSLDHKASDQYQQKRIVEAGGKIYQTKIRNANPNVKIFYDGAEHPFILGPYRAFPGRLSVTRTFGDIDAKLRQLGGNPRAIICGPQIKKITVSPDDDFIILGCDGIYDKMSNDEVIEVVWDTFNRDKGAFSNLHEFCGLAIENIMKLAFHKKTLDNITVVMIALEGLQSCFQNPNEVKPQTAENKPGESRRSKGISRIESQFQRRYVGRSVSPQAQNQMPSKTYYRPL